VVPVGAIARKWDTAVAAAAVAAVVTAPGRVRATPGPVARASGAAAR
jgi:hypothetical protein